jgi:prolyl-tRNA synthetase
MRAREFLMKDAYSFHINEESLQETYDLMYQTYSNIFRRLGLDFRAVLADTGNIGGSTSHEFHVLAESGEDEIVFSSESGYAANIELANGTIRDLDNGSAQMLPAHEVATGDAHSIEDVAALLGIAATRLIKILIVKAEVSDTNPHGLLGLVLRGDQELNDIKAEKIPGIVTPLTFASDSEIEQILGCKPGCLGPLKLPFPVVVDHSAETMRNFVCGANKDGFHLADANWERDCRFDSVADIRKVREGDLSPDGKGELLIKRGIEVGHIFQLGTKYSEAMNASVLDENGRSVLMTMGCYGIGVSRIVASAIEQNHDENGIIWPDAIAPFHIAIIPLNAHKSPRVTEVSEKLMADLEKAGYEVLLDDRDKKTSPGVKFADMELMGIPHRIVVSDRGLENDELEYKSRRAESAEAVALSSVLEFLAARINR